MANTSSALVVDAGLAGVELAAELTEHLGPGKVKHVHTHACTRACAHMHSSTLGVTRSFTVVNLTLTPTLTLILTLTLTRGFTVNLTLTPTLTITFPP